MATPAMWLGRRTCITESKAAPRNEIAGIRPQPRRTPLDVLLVSIHYRCIYKYLRSRFASLSLSPPVESSALSCLCAQTRRVDRLLNRIYDDALRPLGINTMQKSLLTNIRRSPDGADFGELSDRLAMDRSTLTRNLSTLEHAGLVAVAPNEHDGRKRVILLTDAGRHTETASVALWRDAQDRVVDALGFERAKELTTLLASVEQTMRELD